MEAGFLPLAHEVFKPLLADPRELQYALRDVVPVGHRNLGEAAIGDYLGIYRWALPGDAYLQLSIGGGVFGRFDLYGTSNALQVVDFYGNLPFDLRLQRWSFRFMPFHTSSHLGDDYIKATGIVPQKHGWDNLRWLISYDALSWLRFYGGYNYVVRTLPGADRHAAQGGVEMYFPWWGNEHARFYWANDMQTWERVHWNPMFTSQAGVKFVRNSHEHRGISLFTEYMSGRQPQGQFYLNRESRWNFGIKFDLT